ncbi:SDR family oxidoreductase [Undibacterium sp. CY18W]|uniref:SDR family oxidoreductase n=1 Tax=Undibacterium hunanense TaxID=2762292 RepID=A0ABR6ZKR5_9BURK|nr:SDR family oxidoreductase [Undibacterium hunanense]MBC3916495.1 SDR family oxidoreductase [Undibacterium hunanense]
MRIFLTGATGFIGSKIIPELINAGHQVLGLTRSDAGALALAEAGATVHRGDIEDLDSLRAGADKCDGVIHTAFDHNFQHFVANCDKDHRVIMALGEVLDGSERPLVITSVTPVGMAIPGQAAIEDYFNPAHPNPRKASELAAWELLQRGIHVSAVRLSQIHDADKQGLVTSMIALAREKGVSAYVGEGLNCWSAAHVSDTSRLYRLALEKGQAGARYHATAEEAIKYRDIAETIGERLAIPVLSLSKEEAPGHFGWLSMFADKDMSATSTKTRELLQWHPTGPGLLESIRQISL